MTTNSRSLRSSPSASSATGSSGPLPVVKRTPTPTPTPPPAGALWYNGDFDGVDGLTNEQDTFAEGYSRIYDDFNVPDAAGWDVNSVFSNNLASTNISSATFEIRQGVSEGNPGTLIASGTTVTPEVTPTGRSGFGFIEFMVQVNDLNIHLDPGNYFLNVTPVDNLDGGRSFDSTTSGATASARLAATTPIRSSIARCLASSSCRPTSSDRNSRTSPWA